MQPSQKLPTATGLGGDLSHLRSLFAQSFPFQEADASASRNGIQTDECDQTAAADADFDWSITLGNINELTEAAKANVARLQVAEERALRAEARAKEAEHWLRRLHQAVLDGLPSRASAGK